MREIVLDQDQVIVGVDTHKWEHVAVAVNAIGRRVGEVAVAATPAGHQAMLDWARSVGTVAAFGVEGTGSYGSGLARFLRRNGHAIVEVSRPPRRGRAPTQRKERSDRRGACRSVRAGGQGISYPEIGGRGGRDHTAGQDRPR